MSSGCCARVVDKVKLEPTYNLIFVACEYRTLDKADEVWIDCMDGSKRCKGVVDKLYAV